MTVQPQPVSFHPSSNRTPVCAVPADRSDGLEEAVLAMSVLIVEDEAMIAWTMESLLEEIGFTSIAIAASGEDAVRQATKTLPGLIISDINLGPGGMDGVEAAVAMNSDVQPPVVFITGYASAEARSRIARDVPGAIVLRKPVGLEELRQAINNAVGRREAN